MYQDISMFSTHFLFERNNIFSFLFPVIYYIKSLKHYLMFSLHEWLNPSISSVIRKATFLHSVVQLFCETDNCFSGFNFHTVLQRWGIVCKNTAVSFNLSSLNQCKIMHNNINNIVYTQIECVCFCCGSLETIQIGQPCSHVLGDFFSFLATTVNTEWLNLPAKRPPVSSELYHCRTVLYFVCSAVWNFPRR